MDSQHASLCTRFLHQPTPPKRHTCTHARTRTHKHTRAHTYTHTDTRGHTRRPLPLQDALRQLLVLDALDSNGDVTPMGKRMAGLPLEPSLARALLAARELGCAAAADGRPPSPSQYCVMFACFGVHRVCCTRPNGTVCWCRQQVGSLCARWCCWLCRCVREMVSVAAMLSSEHVFLAGQGPGDAANPQQQQQGQQQQRG